MRIVSEWLFVDWSIIWNEDSLGVVVCRLEYME